jgi:hypothetical protein
MSGSNGRWRRDPGIGGGIGGGGGGGGGRPGPRIVAHPAGKICYGKATLIELGGKCANIPPPPVLRERGYDVDELRPKWRGGGWRSSRVERNPAVRDPRGGLRNTLPQEDGRRQQNRTPSKGSASRRGDDLWDMPDPPMEGVLDVSPVTTTCRKGSAKTGRLDLEQKRYQYQLAQFEAERAAFLSTSPFFEEPKQIEDELIEAEMPAAELRAPKPAVDEYIDSLFLHSAGADERDMAGGTLHSELSGISAVAPLPVTTSRLGLWSRSMPDTNGRAGSPRAEVNSGLSEASAAFTNHAPVPLPQGQQIAGGNGGGNGIFGTPGGSPVPFACEPPLQVHIEQSLEPAAVASTAVEVDLFKVLRIDDRIQDQQQKVRQNDQEVEAQGSRFVFHSNSSRAQGRKASVLVAPLSAHAKARLGDLRRQSASPNLMVPAVVRRRASTGTGSQILDP